MLLTSNIHTMSSKTINGVCKNSKLWLQYLIQMVNFEAQSWINQMNLEFNFNIESNVFSTCLCIGMATNMYSWYSSGGGDTNVEGSYLYWFVLKLWRYKCAKKLHISWRYAPLTYYNWLRGRPRNTLMARNAREICNFFAHLYLHNG